MKKILIAAIASIAVCSGVFAQSTTNVSGNGNTGFGGVIGTGSLFISNNASGTLDFVLTKGTASFNDAIVLYIDSISGGFANTASFNDQADPLRSAISGASGGSTGLDANTRSIVAFNTGFQADFAIGLNITPSAFGGLWSLASGGNNSLPFVTGVNLSPNNSATSATYSWSLNVTNLGLSVNSGQSFKFVGTYLNPTNSFRANEAIGFNISGGNPGNGGIGAYPTTTATSEASFTTVPEPSTYALLALSAAAMGGYFVRRRQR